VREYMLLWCAPDMSQVEEPADPAGEGGMGLINITSWVLFLLCALHLLFTLPGAELPAW
jgi:hypothetical protein